MIALIARLLFLVAGFTALLFVIGLISATVTGLILMTQLLSDLAHGY